MAKDYSLVLQAKLDASQEIEKQLIKKKKEWQSKGYTDIKIRTHIDDGYVKKATGTFKNASGNIQRYTAQAAKGVDALNGELRVTKTETTGAAKATNYFGKGMVEAGKTAAQYALGLGLIYKALQEIGKGVQYIKDLDKEMRDIQIVAGYTDEQIKALATDYNELAKAMGATTLEVASGSLEWTRQGKSIAETQELLNSTLMLSKLGNVEAAEATEYLTSTLNGFKMEAEEAEGVVDKLVAVDNAAATSVKELATALQKSSVSAQAAGVDFDTLVAYIGTVSSITRLSAETVGTSFKTMFARFQDIKEGAIDGEGAINNVERALGRLTLASGEQMSILDRQTGEFKEFSTVIEELAGQWHELSEMEQANIVKAFAGVRQRESFLALMENQAMMHQLLAEEMNAEGLAADRYAIYLEGLEAAQNKATAAWEGMIQATVEGGLIKWFYDAQAGLFGFIEGLGGLDTLLAGISAALVTYGVGMLSAEIATGGLTLAWKALTLAIKANPLGLLAIAIAAVTVAAVDLNNEIKKSSQGVADNWTSEMEKVAASTDDTGEILGAFSRKMTAMNDVFENSGTIALAFVDETKLIEDGLKAVFPILERSTEGWTEYKESIDEAAEIAGYSIDEFGKLYKERSDGFKMYVDGIETVTRSQYEARTATDGWVNSVRDLGEEVSGAEKAILGFTETFQEFIEQSFRAKEDTGISEEFETYYQNLSDINRLYQEGILDMDAYFAQLQNGLESTDFSEMFGEDVDSAEIFFAGLTENALTALDTINSAFESETISMTEYTEQMAGWGNMLVKIGEIGSELGLSDAIPESLGAISEAVDGITQSLEINAAVEASIYELKKGDLVWETGAYNERMEMIAKLADASGVVIKDVEGNIIEGSQNIQNWLLQSEGNFARLADQTASQAGQSINNLVRAAGIVLEEFAKSIGSFSANIDFIPKGEAPTLQGIFGDLLGTGKINMPSFGYEVTANATGSFTGLSNAISAMAKGLQSSDIGLDWDADINVNSDVAKRKYDELGDTIGSLTSRLKEMNKETGKTGEEVDKDAKAMSSLLDMVIAKIKQTQQAKKDALKDDLRNYKRIIDARKALIDTMAEEEEYQKKLAENQKDLGNIQSEMEELRLDDSEEAQARLRQLQEEAAEIQLKIDEEAAERSRELQKDALDDEYDEFEKNIQKKIDKIDELLSQPGRIMQMALKMIEKKGKWLYESLVKWNALYGTGVKQDVTDAWEDAYEALKKYKSALDALRKKKKKDDDSYTALGLGDGGEYGSPDILDTILKNGGGVPDLDIGKDEREKYEPLGSGGDFSVEKMMEFNVAGDMDSTMIPEIEKIAKRVLEEMNKAMRDRGRGQRGAGQYQI